MLLDSFSLVSKQWFELELIISKGQSLASGKHAHKEPETDMAKQIKALIQVLDTTRRAAR